MSEGSRKFRFDRQRLTLKIVLAGMFVALAFIIDLIAKFIPFLHMPQGGSINFTILPLVLAALYLGPGYGIVAGVCFGLLNFIFDGMVIHWGSIFLDYVIAFGAVGLVGFFRPLFYRNKIWAYIVAITIAAVLRYVSSSLSGVIFFGSYAPEGVNPWFYSFVLYNAAYMGPSLGVSLAIGLAVYRPLQRMTHQTPFNSLCPKIRSDAKVESQI